MTKKRWPHTVWSEWVFPVGFGALVLLLASLPQILGWLGTPKGFVFLGLPYNADDAAVYLSWMRQAQEGRFFLVNRFTTEPQTGILFNLFFWFWGNVARFSGLHALVIFQVMRVVCGVSFLGAVYRLAAECFSERRIRQAGFGFIAIGAGFGWFWQDYSAARGLNQPVDLWQPEAIPFLSLYTMPLFAAGLAAIAWFLQSVLRAERTSRFADLVPALTAGFLLGNFHSYDVIPLFTALLAYRILTDGINRTMNWAAWLRVVAVGLAMFPTTAYQAYVLKADAVFYERAFVSSTPSTAVWWVLLGFGLPLLLSVFEVIRRKHEIRTDNVLRFLVVWAVVGVAVAYIPVSFQRKMLMGAFLPIGLLAGSGLASLASRLSGDYPKIVLAFGVLLAAPSNGLFLLRDTERLRQNIGSTEHRPYLAQGEADALSWLRDNGKSGDVVLCAPDPTSHKRFPGFALRPYLSVWIPAFTSCTVYNGHWSETVRFPRKMQTAGDFFSAAQTNTTRRDFLLENRVRYLLVPGAFGDAPFADVQGNIFYTPIGWPKRDVPAYLRVAYKNEAVTIFSVDASAVD